MSDRNKKSTASLGFEDLIRRPPPSTSAWPGRSIMVRHRADGSVVATSRGQTAVGTTEAEALARLARMAAMTQRESTDGTDNTIPVPNQIR
jgi:hypothetical protein